MTDADLRAPRPVRVGAFVAVGLLHLVAAVLLVRAFAPDFTAEVARRVVSTFTVTVTAAEPTPSPAPSSSAAVAVQPAGQAGTAGNKGRPRAVAAPVPKVALARSSAPPVAGTGNADRAGAATGSGTGAGGNGAGLGSGGAGKGTGGGGSGLVKISGDINSARDYPIASRDLRLGDYVVIWLTVGTDGRPTACKVARASRDGAADAITCRLAMERFRFRPALDASGAPVVATYGWRQRWFLKE